MAIHGIHHFTLVVPDLSLAVEFYRSVLGFALVQELNLENDDDTRRLTGLDHSAARGAMLKAGWGYLRLLEFENKHPQHQFFWNPVNKPGWRHFSLITGDAMRFYERTRNDILWHGEPASHSVEGPENEAWADYGRDPFGNVVELWSLGKSDPQPFAPELPPHPVNPGMGHELRADTSQDVLGIHHPALVTPDLEAAQDFYCGVLGFSSVQDGPIEPTEYAERLTQLPAPRAIGKELKTPWLYLEVWEFLHPVWEGPEEPEVAYNQFGISSICLMVDDCHAEYARLGPHIRFLSAPVSVGSHDNPSWKAVGRDPFGNLLELWQTGPRDPLPFAPQNTVVA
jgi:glyoxylase I family protein